jgi:hypothetical protein
MPKNARLSGHTLRAEGKPFVRSQDSSWHVRANALHGFDTKGGFALCSCGEVSQLLYSDAERKRWHGVHKQTIREEAASPASSLDGKD